jgi:two-component system phosphate regulon sensor histidine kinase PhoR
MRALRTRFALTGIAAAAAALAVALLLVGPRIRDRIVAGALDGLTAETRLVADLCSEPLASGMPRPELEALTERLSRVVGGRVTLIDAQGVVLADSSVALPDLDRVENHGHRPEVLEALQGGSGSARRRSSTIGEELLYAAVAVRRDGRLLGIARLARRWEGLESEAAALRASIALAAGVALLLTGALAAAFSSALAGPLQDLMETARRFGSGDHLARVKVERDDELGELGRVLNTAADKLRDELMANARDRARTAAILAAMEDGLLAVDHRGVVRVANDSLRRSLDLGEPLGRPYVEVVRQTEVGRVLEEVLRTGERRQAEVEVFRLRRFYLLTGVPFPDAEGAPHGAVLTFHDVTQARQVERMRRDFVANASHELRTPLTSIRGFVEALEDGALDEPGTGRRFLGKIRFHADRMATLIEDLLELSRIESGAQPPLYEAVAPADLAEEVVGSFADAASRKEIALLAREEGAPSVESDPERLRRILDNLVDNALKYTPAGGHVSVTSRAEDAGAAIVVEDDGPGIAAEHLPRIFERFYRVDKARSRELGGTGLGLSIVKHLAEGMGARVAVESEVGRFTRFTVHLPPAPPARG